MAEGFPSPNLQEDNPLAPLEFAGYTEDGEWVIFKHPETGDRTLAPVRTYFEFIDNPSQT
jgi:hypothetical protein